MNTSIANRVRAVGARLTTDWLYVQLEDGREIGLAFTRVPWLAWLAHATPEQRAHWTVEPGGYALYWPALDDGLEVGHLLAQTPLAAPPMKTLATLLAGVTAENRHAEGLSYETEFNNNSVGQQ